MELAAAAGGEMSVLSAIILGVVEGITEYLPISSTGHLILAGDALGVDGPFAKNFDIFIQLGAILAVVMLYFNRFTGLLKFERIDPLNEKNGLQGLRGLVLLAIASIPVSVLGVLFHKKIKALLFYPKPVAIALIAGGLILWFVEKLPRRESNDSYDRVDFKTAFYIGVFQAFALIPGMSRSACTIIGGMYFGLTRRAAAEFSFILAVPVLCAAVVFDLAGIFKTITADQFKLLAVGFAVSFVVAAVSIKLMMQIISRWSFRPFAVYRILLGLLVLYLL